MRAYVRVRPLTDDEYQHLKRLAASRKLAAGRVKRAQVILLRRCIAKRPLRVPQMDGAQMWARRSSVPQVKRMWGRRSSAS